MAKVGKPNLDRIEAGHREILLRVCRLVDEAGGRAWLVGGTVRDGVLGSSQRDLDLEVFGLPGPDLRAALGAVFALDLVGESFGILKLREAPIDVGLPRRESKAGQGHRAFDVTADPDLPLADAAARRDFTINAIYFDPLQDEVADPFGGLSDLGHRLLRHTSPAFGEDPLRVLRGMQFVARFLLDVVPGTLAECRRIGFEELPSERVFEEWKKLILQGEEPGRGLRFLRDTTWLRFFPELEATVGCPQDPRHHPEGDVWTHTGHCLDAFAAERTDDPHEDLVVGLAVLCHDLGKPLCTQVESGGRLRALGHEKAGVEVAEHFLARLTNQRKLVLQVLPLVAEHMAPSQLAKADASDAAVRRLAKRVGRIDRLLRVARADALGRPPLGPDPFPAGPWLSEKAHRLSVLEAQPEALVQGRDLLQLGWSAGPHLKEILDRVYEAQLEGHFMNIEGGQDYVRHHFTPKGK